MGMGTQPSWQAIWPVHPATLAPGPRPTINNWPEPLFTNFRAAGEFSPGKGPKGSTWTLARSPTLPKSASHAHSCTTRREWHSRVQRPLHRDPGAQEAPDVGWLNSDRSKRPSFGDRCVYLCEPSEGNNYYGQWSVHGER